MILIGYSGCTTCKNARRWLETAGIDFEFRDVKEVRPTADEIRAWSVLSATPLKKFFNTSGQVYRSLGLKDKLGGMTDAELVELLASDGMLVKRPLLVGDDFVLVGFKEPLWREKFGV